MDIFKNSGMNADAGAVGRKSIRFRVPGATVMIGQETSGHGAKRSLPERSPVVDLSKSGVSFLTDTVPKLSRISILLIYSDEEDPLPLEGRVVYFVPRGSGLSYRYRVGVEFFPFSIKKGHNTIESLCRLERLASLYGSDGA
jgi:hypothetical protein